MEGLKVAELAERAGLAPSTVRFYERAGPLSPARRAPNGYRIFGTPRPARRRPAQYREHVTRSQHTHPPTLRRRAAIGLGVTAITASVLLIAADAITGNSRWTHHPGISATPLLLIAAAIAAGSLAYPQQRRRLMPVIAALAFTAWGLAQLLPSSAAAGYLNDTAILLFVTDAAYAVYVNARTASPATQPPGRTAPEPASPTDTPQPCTRP